MSGFFDTFFVVTAGLVAALMLADWLIGKHGRGLVKQRVGDFWTVIQDNSVDRLFLGLCARASRTGDRYLGGNKFGLRSLLASCVLNLILLIPGLWFASELVGLGTFDLLVGGLRDPEGGNQFLLLFLLISFGAGWPAFAGVRWAFDVRTSCGNWRQIFGILGRLLLSAVLITLLASGILYSSLALGPDPAAGGESGMFAILFLIALSLVVSAATLFAAWPIVVGAVLLVTIVALKLARPVLQPVLSLVLARLYESDKGVLTQISLALGSAVKVLQEVLKSL